MNRKLRHKRIRFKIKGTAKRPRFSIFRSIKGMDLQLINDQTGCTLVSVNHKELKGKFKNKIEQANALGKLLAKKAKKAKITTVVFDRGGYKYHGRVKAAADGAKQGKLIF